MNNRKTAIRFFTIADYEEEEIFAGPHHTQRTAATVNKTAIPVILP